MGRAVRIAPLMGGGCSSASPAAAAGVKVAVAVRGGACGGVVRRPQRSHSVPHPLVCRWAAVAGRYAQVGCLRFHRFRCLLLSSSRSISSTHVRLSHAIHPPAPVAPPRGTGHPPFCFESIVLRLLARHCSCRYLRRRATSRRLGSSSPSCRSTTRSQMIRRTGLSSDSVSESSLELTHPCPCVLQYAAAAPA